MHFFSCFASTCKFKRNKLWQLYLKGQSRIEREFDIVDILKSIRHLKIHSKKNMDELSAAETKYDDQNAIDLDVIDDSFSDNSNSQANDSDAT